jgi:hypothetical protein
MGCVLWEVVLGLILQDDGTVWVEIRHPLEHPWSETDLLLTSLHNNTISVWMILNCVLRSRDPQLQHRKAVSVRRIPGMGS